MANLSDRSGFTFYRVDICDIEAYEASVHWPRRIRMQISAVLNLAALAGVRGSVEDPRTYYEVNVLGTLRYHGVDAGSMAWANSFLHQLRAYTVAEIDGHANEGADSSRPLSPYAASKKAAETLLHSYHQLHGIDGVVLRYFTVYGPAGRPDMSVFRFLRSIVGGETITVFGDGTQQRDFTYVDDIAGGTVAALGVTGYETINLGYGSPVVLNDVISLIEDAVGKEARIVHEERHPADPMMTWADVSRAGRPAWVEAKGRN